MIRSAFYFHGCDDTVFSHDNDEKKGCETVSSLPLLGLLGHRGQSEG